MHASMADLPRELDRFQRSPPAPSTSYRPAIAKLGFVLPGTLTTPPCAAEGRLRARDPTNSRPYWLWTRKSAAKPHRPSTDQQVADYQPCSTTQTTPSLTAELEELSLNVIENDHAPPGDRRKKRSSSQ